MSKRKAPTDPLAEEPGDDQVKKTKTGKVDGKAEKRDVFEDLELVVIPGKDVVVEYPINHRNWAKPIDIERKLSKRRADAWLARSKSWKSRLTFWKPVKVLGIGGYGICGLFEYKDDRRGPKKHVVVKQVAYKSDENDQPESKMKGLVVESELLNLCQRACDSDHIVKPLKLCDFERGTGTSKFLDPSDEELPVARMYLEYCEWGDLRNFLETANCGEHVWRIWECLAKALMVLENGREEQSDQVWTVPGGVERQRPIVHFDIKPDNIFFGGDSRDPDLHTDIDIAKEQSLHALYGYRIGTPSNIFSVAKCIYAIIMQGHIFDMGYRFRVATEDGDEMWASGIDLVTNKLPYSQSLRGLVITCLAHNPDSRPTAQQLLKEIQFALDSYRRWALQDPEDFEDAHAEEPPRFVAFEGRSFVYFGRQYQLEEVEEKGDRPDPVSGKSWTSLSSTRDPLRQANTRPILYR